MHIVLSNGDSIVIESSRSKLMINSDDFGEIQIGKIYKK